MRLLRQNHYNPKKCALEANRLGSPAIGLVLLVSCAALDAVRARKECARVRSDSRKRGTGRSCPTNAGERLPLQSESVSSGRCAAR